MSCRCRGKEGLELILCLAPPPGDHEISIDIGKGREVVINSTGIYVRAIVSDDYLPFIRTTSLAVSEITLKKFGLKYEDLLCKTVRGLLEASNHGSETAATLVKECSDMITSILSNCGEGD
ncbi:hypothetical protein [Acidilobus sp.]|jgi:hypothetical protein|uniref:hypothetical protein n=1 Tax=Acidilobus sp. TaxID=1872109 RepID=UPI003D04AB4B